MRRALFLIAVATWAVGVLATSVPRAAGRQPQSAHVPSPPSGADGTQYGSVLNQYCVTCHNERTKAAELALEKRDFTNIPADAEPWEKALRKLQRGAMPPLGVRRPEQATYDRLINWLESEIDRASAARPNPGRPLPHRLNRAEYANAIRDLLALDVGDVSSLLPPDDSAYGFDNIADVLGVSPVLTERYVSAAGKISALAVGDPDVAAGSDTYLVRQDLSQDQHIEGLPLGTIGGVLVQHTFPVDGEYELRATLFRTNVDQTRGLEYAQQVEFTVDGERAFVTSVGGEAPGTPGGADEAAARTPRLSRSDSVDVKLRVR